MMRLSGFIITGVLLAQAAAAQIVRVVPVGANDLAYSPLTNRVYASVPATNGVLEIDPATGATGPALFVGSAPNRLALSDTGEYLYVALDGAASIARVHLPTRTVDLLFSLGNDSFSGPYYAQDMVVLPGNPDALAVSRRYANSSPSHAGVAVYDRGVQRLTTTPGHTGSNVIEPGAMATRLYGLNTETTEFGFRRMAVDAGGVTVIDATPNLLQSFAADIEYANGRIYTTTGAVIEPETRTLVGTFPGIPFDSVVEPDVAAGVVYFLTANLGSSLALQTFDAATFLPIDTLSLPGVSGMPGSLIRCGAGGLAFRTSANQVVLIPVGAIAPVLPEITILSPTADPFMTLSAATFDLSGTAADVDGSVASVTWSTDRGFSGTASGTNSWSAYDIPLAPGFNTVTVTVTDNAGFTSTDSLVVSITGFSYYLTEGATGSFFDLDLLLANPNAAATNVTVQYNRDDSTFETQTLTLAPTSRTTIRVDDVPGLENAALSTLVVSGLPLVVERTMRWDDAGQYGAHTEKAVAHLARQWFFAEGSEGFFYTYLLLGNPSPEANTATVDWLLEGGSPVRRRYPIGAFARATIDVGADPDLVGRSFGIIVTFDQPATAERTMYFGAPTDVLFKGGHASAGASGPSTTWFLAEGATGRFFETFILMANPNAATATATLTFLPESGSPVVRTVSIPAMGRTTVNIEALTPAAPTLANTAVATQVTSSLPIVVERSQYWPFSPAQWYEAHNSVGVTSAAMKWGLAEGRVGNPPGLPAAEYQTYVLLANPGDTTASVAINFLRTDGTTVQKTFQVAPTSRLNVAINGTGGDVPELSNETFGAVIESNRPIVVERAMYGNAGTQIWASGTDATATRLP